MEGGLLRRKKATGKTNRNKRMHQFRVWGGIIAVAAGLLAGCDSGPPPVDPAEIKVGVLLAAHGSKSSEWKQMLETLADEVREPIMQGSNVAGVRLAYISEADPNIASQMRAFDEEGYDEVIVVPLVIAVESQRTNHYLHYLTGIRSEIWQIKQLE